MHEQAQENNSMFINAGLAEYALYDGVHLPYRDGAFTKILSVNTLYFWQAPTTLMAQIARVLVPGGRSCLSFCTKDFMSTLPFTRYGFTLYDTADVVALAAHLPLKVVGEQHLQDMAVGASGALVHRTFVNLVFEKTA